MDEVLSQKIDGEDHPIAFFSKRLGPCEQRWPVHEKELLAIKTALEKWPPYLHGRKFDVYTDSSACSWMLYHPRVSFKMARFLTFFSEYEFMLHHVQGRSNVVADALSRPPDPDQVVGTADDEDPVPGLETTTPDPTHTVNECDEHCAEQDRSLRRHVVDSASIRSFPLGISHLLLDDADWQGESREIGVAQVQVHNVELHVVSAHLADEVKRNIQRGYAKDPEFACVWKKPSPNSPYAKEKALVLQDRQLYSSRLRAQRQVADHPDSVRIPRWTNICSSGVAQDYVEGVAAVLLARDDVHRPSVCTHVRNVCTVEDQRATEERLDDADSESTGVLGSSFDGFHHRTTSLRRI